MNFWRGGTACRHGATPTSCALLYAHYTGVTRGSEEQRTANSFAEETAWPQ